MDFHRLVLYNVFDNAHAKNSLKWATSVKFHFLPTNFDRKTPQVYLVTDTKSNQMKKKSIWGVTKIRNSPRCSATCRFWCFLAIKHEKKIIWAMQGGFLYLSSVGTIGIGKKKQKWQQKKA